MDFLFFQTDASNGVYRLSSKNGPPYNFVIHDPSEKNYIGNEMALKTVQI
jgi:hypothetical protein